MTEHYCVVCKSTTGLEWNYCRGWLCGTHRTHFPQDIKVVELERDVEAARAWLSKYASSCGVTYEQALRCADISDAGSVIQRGVKALRKI